MLPAGQVDRADGAGAALVLLRRAQAAQVDQLGLCVRVVLQGLVNLAYWVFRFGLLEASEVIISVRFRVKSD